MSVELGELYQELIIDHSRHPRHYHALASATHSKEGYNPLCGDQVTVYAQVENGVVKDISFQGSGCAISVASASLMTEALKGQSLERARHLFEQFRARVSGDVTVHNESLGKLVALLGVCEFPMRVKCATLAWHTLFSALAEGGH